MPRKPARTRARSAQTPGKGRLVGSEPRAGGDSRAVHLGASIMAAAARSLADPAADKGVMYSDLRVAVRTSPRHRLIIFIVDASESMGEGTTARMTVAKGAVMALLNSAYLSRDRVAMVTFQDNRATLMLPPTGSIDVAREKLRKLPVGGSSPLAMGLVEGWTVVRKERRTDPDASPLLVLLSDGNANAPIENGADPDREALAIAKEIAGDGIPAIIIETTSKSSGDLMPSLADIFATKLCKSSHLETATLIKMVDSAKE